MSIYGLSVAVRARMPVYPGDPPVDIDTPVALANGEAANVSRLRLGAHTGTHVDAPAHFLAEGRRVSDLSLDALIGEARITEIPETVRAIGPEHVTHALVEGDARAVVAPSLAVPYSSVARRLSLACPSAVSFDSGC